MALLEERPGARVVARRERQVAEVVDRERRDPRVADLAGELDRLLEHGSRALVVARREDDRAEVAQRVRDEPPLAVAPGGVEGRLRRAGRRCVVALQQGVCGGGRVRPAQELRGVVAPVGEGVVETAARPLPGTRGRTRSG